MALQIILLTLAIVLTFIVGASIIILRHLGRKDHYAANHVFAQALFTGVLISLLIGIIWYFGATQIFQAIREESYLARSYGMQYLRIIALSAPLVLINFIALGILRSVGDTLKTMLISVLGNMINLILAPLLIYGLWIFPRLEVQGAAYALIIAQVIAFLVTFSMLRKRKFILFLPFSEFFTPKLETFLRILRLGLPTTVEQFVWAVGQLVLSIYVAQMGVVYLAVHQILVRIQSILTMFYYGLGTGSMSMVGKFIGSVQFSKLNRTAIISALAGLTISIIIGLMLYALQSPVLHLFSSDSEVITMGEKIMAVFILVQFPKVLNIIFSNNLRAAADNKWLMILALISVIVFEIALSYGLAFFLGLYLTGIWLIQGIDELFRLILNNFRFFRKDWNNLLKKQEL